MTKAGMMVWKRSFTGRVGVGMGLIHGKHQPAVLQGKTGSWYDDAGTEIVVDALDQRYHVACGVCRR